MTYFKNKTVIMSGGSRGVGLEIAKALGKDGANIAILAKTTEPHPTLPGTIYTAAEEIEQVGGSALPVVCDIRFEEQVEAAVEETVSKFGSIDICINNASAIHLTDTVNTPMKRYDLMHNINVRGTFMLSQKCIPYLKNGDNPHILTLSPPLDIDRKWFGNFEVVIGDEAHQFKSKSLTLGRLFLQISTIFGPSLTRNGDHP